MVFYCWVTNDPNVSVLIVIIFFHNSVGWEFRNSVGNLGSWGWEVHFQDGFLMSCLIPFCSLAFSLSMEHIIW